MISHTDFYGKKFESIIDPSAIISPYAHVAKFNVKIGAGSLIESNVTLKENVEIGARCIIRSGTVLGGAGFEFKKRNSTVIHIPHSGGVKIGDDVEIQHNCAVDRSVFGGVTSIGNMTKIDNLVHIAHNCRA